MALYFSIFWLAFFVRVFYWADDPNTTRQQSSMVSRYQAHAEALVEGSDFFSSEGSADETKIKKLIHPPGYPLWIAFVYKLFPQNEASLVYAHIVWNALSVVLLFALTAALLPRPIAVIAAILAAISPHLAYHSIILLPDSLAALPILTAVYLLIRAYKKSNGIKLKEPSGVLGAQASCLLTSSRQDACAPSLIGAGVCLGLSCWLRANGLLLFLFAGIIILLLFRERRRWYYAAALTLAVIVAIAPVTIRNWLIYDSFVPLSLGAGVTLVEGIADYDRENRFGMPIDDEDAVRKDQEWHGRSDYATLWRPDGIARDRYRFQRGMEVIRENKIWFLSVMVRRAASMVRYNDNWQLGYPADTAKAPVMLTQVAYGHDLNLTKNHSAIWSADAETLFAEGRALQNAALAMNPEKTFVGIQAGDTTGELFTSRAIAVQKDTDYVLQIEAKLRQKPVTLLITNEKRDLSLAYLPLGETNEERPLMTIPFATNNAEKICLVIIGDGAPQAAVSLGKGELFEAGATPYLWTTHLRTLIRRLQKDLFKTECMIALIVIGIALLIAVRQWQTLGFLLLVPAYYFCVQSVFHTEYRYILPLHYFLFAVAAIAIYTIGVTIFYWVRKGILIFRKTL